MSREAAVIALNPAQWRRTADEREFLPAALEIMDTPAFPVGRAIGGVIVGAVVVSLAWACIGKVDIIAIAAPEDVALAGIKLRAQMAGQDAKVRALDEQVIQKQSEADEATAGIAKIQASLPWMLQETNIRRQAKTLQYGNQVAWVEAERSLVEEQKELGVLARHREQAVAARAGLGRQREQAVAEFQDGVLGDLAKARATTSPSYSPL